MIVLARNGFVLLALGAATTAVGQTVPYSAAIGLPEAEVRCLPGTGSGSYATNRLRQGQRVEVLRERDDGWLEIRPPAGSFSWINARSVSQVVANLPNYVVEAAAGKGAPVLIGSEVLQQRPTVEGARLQRGTQLRAIGRPRADAEGTWLPIEPPPGEIRYLRAEAIARAPSAPAAPPPLPPPSQPAPPPAARVASSPGPGPLGSFRNPGQAGSALAPLADVDALWQRAIQAERAGNVGEAIRLYTQVGNESATSNRQLAIDALNRAHSLREAHRYPSSVFYPAGQVISPAPAAVTPTTVQPPAAAPGVRLIAPATGVSYSRAPAGSAGSAETYGTPSSGPGRLRASSRYLVPNQRLYVLEDPRCVPIVYAAPQPGIDLEPYLGRQVELFGPTSYQGALRASYMSVLRVVPLN